MQIAQTNTNFSTYYSPEIYEDVFELETITPLQIGNLLVKMVPMSINQRDPLYDKIIHYIQDDLRKFGFIQTILQP